MKSINVVGGGFSGLTVALFLAHKGFKVCLYEKQNRLGGLLGTHKTPHGLAEQAANGMISTESSQALFKELGLKPLGPLKTARSRFIFDGRPKRWPLQALESVLFAARVGYKLFRKGKSEFLPASGETLQSWGLKNLGSAATFKILEPAMQGIYANELKDLSASLILNPLLKKAQAPKKSPYKGQITAEQGMQDLINALEKKLRQLGVEIHLGQELDLQNLQVPTVLATSLKDTQNLLKDVLPEVGELFNQTQMSSLISVKVFFAETPSEHQGFGVLIPRDQNLRTYGVLRNSFIFTGRDQNYNETWILGGLDNEDLLTLNDSELMDLILKERRQIFGLDHPPLSYLIHRWPQALPVYNTELESALNNLKKINHQAPIYLHGNYLGGIGLSKILERSHSLANRLEKVYG